MSCGTEPYGRGVKRGPLTYDTILLSAVIMVQQIHGHRDEYALNYWNFLELQRYLHTVSIQLSRLSTSQTERIPRCASLGSSGVHDECRPIITFCKDRNLSLPIASSIFFQMSASLPSTRQWKLRVVRDCDGESVWRCSGTC